MELLVVGDNGPELVERGAFTEQLHPRGKGAQGGQFVAKGASSDQDTVGFDAKRGTGAGYGVKGGDKRVKQLQNALNRLGFTDAAGHPLLVDGKLGPRTTAAIKRLQRKLGMKADGKVTPALLSQVRKAAGPRGLKGAKKAAPAKGAHKAPAKKVAKKVAPVKKAVPPKTAPPSKRTYSGHA